MKIPTIEEIEKRTEVVKLALNLNDYLIEKFFDHNSFKNLDRKLEVLKGLKSGEIKTGSEEYYEILELYPTDKNARWD